MTNTTNPRNTRELIKRLRALPGVEVELGRKHYRVTLNGRVVGTLASTPSDGRAILNTVSDLRRNGVDVRAMRITS